MTEQTSLSLRNSLLYPIFTSFAVSLAIFFLSRISLSLWQAERILEPDWWYIIIFNGIRVDISSLCYLFILPTLMLVLFGGRSLFGKVWVYLYRIWIVFGLWLIVYMEIATPSFINEYDVRPNRLFIEYLVYPKEVFSMLWTGHRMELFIGATASLLTIILGWKFASHITNNIDYPRRYWRPLLAILVVAIGVLGARGTLQHRPLNPALVAFSSTPLINDLTLNSSYSMIYALCALAKEEDAFSYYPHMSESEIIQYIVSTSDGLTPTLATDNQPILAKHIATTTLDKPKNLVILLQESLGARYVGGLGGLPLTPNLDKLMDEGWSFEQMYATGIRSVRGIEAVISGFPPTPAVSTVKLPKSQNKFFTIADILKQHGYVTQFIYGGESHFDNMKSFFLSNGFNNIQDFPTFDDAQFVGSWGASDEDLYRKAHQQFSMMNKEKKPFFSLVFTSSNHSPYEFPENKIELYNQPATTRENAAKYSDYALGEFFKKAKQSDYWKDTIFLVVADHDSRAYGDEPVPIDHYRIPAVFIGKNIAPRKDIRLASQIDLPVTSLSLIGIDFVSPMQGFDMTKEVPSYKQRAMMQFNNNFAWMDSEYNVVILQPQKKPQGYKYNPEKQSLLKSSVDKDLYPKANANALWGSLAYQKGYYSSVKQPKHLH